MPLGLFDTPPSGRENALALAIVGSIFAGALAVVPFVDTPLREYSAFVPTISAIMFVSDLIIAGLLFAQVAVFQSRALAVLAAGHVFIGLLAVPYVLTFPGAFDGILGGGVNTAAWLFIVRRWAAPVIVILYAWLKAADPAPPQVERRPPSTLVWVATATVLAAAVTAMATAGHDLLPPILVNRSDGISSSLRAVSLSTIALGLIAITMLRRRTSVLDLWLMVSLATLVIQAMLNIGIHTRFTLGFYSLQILILFSHLFVLLALMGESNRLYVRLALASAARDRERDAQLMAMDVVAAAMAHEVGQPLVAASLRASAALKALTRDPPQHEAAIQSLRDTTEGIRRTFDVVRNLRAIFGRKTGSLSEFDLNDLVREIGSLLDRELAAERISLIYALDQGLPPILANRVQIQRVLVNLMMNAIESIGAVRRKGGRIAIRSAAPDGDTLRLEISDSGAGIARDDAGRIFDPFYTTKPTGTGLGLSLSRSFVEDHGGRLWATAGEDGGATFHLELHRKPFPTHQRASPLASVEAPTP